MRLKLPATNQTYVILSVKYVLDGKECVCQMHKLNNNKMDEVEIDVPDGAVVHMVTMNEVTNAHVVVSSQVLYDASEDEPTSSNLKVETQAKATVTKRKDHAESHSSRKTKKQETGRGKESKAKEEK